jgi:hypothetical protein
MAHPETGLCNKIATALAATAGLLVSIGGTVSAGLASQCDHNDSAGFSHTSVCGRGLVVSIIFNSIGILAATIALIAAVFGFWDL